MSKEGEEEKSISINELLFLNVTTAVEMFALPRAFHSAGEEDTQRNRDLGLE